MIRAFRYGAPPHGGLAPGIERIVMLLAQEKNIREIIPFPLNQNAQDLLMGAPSEVQPKQLQELHLKIVPPKDAGQQNPGAPKSDPSQPEPPKDNQPEAVQQKKEQAQAT
jgi:hypothetical protein